MLPCSQQRSLETACFEQSVHTLRLSCGKPAGTIERGGANEMNGQLTLSRSPPRLKCEMQSPRPCAAVKEAKHFLALAKRDTPH